MTIKERMERDAYDRVNPWRPACEAKPDGTICELAFSDLVGTSDQGSARYILHTDGKWIRIDIHPPKTVYRKPTCFRPVFARLSTFRRQTIANVAQGDCA
jgi:hypothetical protein